MLKYPVYNQEGKKTGGEVNLPKEIFGQVVNDKLIHDALLVQRANIRDSGAHTKTRAERRGGGAKPWRQKGTGRARHGSIRSPIWRKGGVVFGPRKDRNFKKKINKKARKKALLASLSSKARDKEIVILDNLSLKKTKTRLLDKILNRLPLGNTVLLVIPQKDVAIARAGKNLGHVKVLRAQDLNILDVLTRKSLLLIKDSIAVVKETIGRKREVVLKKKLLKPQAKKGKSKKR